MSTTDTAQRTRLGTVTRPLSQWVIQRGVLVALLQTPMLALFGGFLLRYTTLPVATLAVFVSFLLLPIWIGYRKSVSRDPDEPVHHLHRYLLWALLPYVVFSIARVPAYYLFDIKYWGLWYGFGAQLTGEAPTSLTALLAGMAMYTVQGIALNTSFYVLFRRHSLLNTLLFIFVFFSTLFSFAFPVYSLAGARPNLTWYVVHWLAHLAMAVVAWSMPALWHRALPRLRLPGRAAVVAAAAMLVLLPYGFAIERALRWQLDAQQRVERTAVDRVDVNTEPGDLTVARAGPEAKYEFKVRIGPRTYRNTNGATRAVEVGPVEVAGQITQDGRTLAWCFGHSGLLPSPNKIRDPGEFTAAAARNEYSSVPVTCHGPAADAVNNGRVLVEWTARARLAGERTQYIRDYTGQRPATLTLTPTR